MTSADTSIHVGRETLQTNLQDAVSVREKSNQKNGCRSGKWIAGFIAGTSALTAFTLLFTKLAICLSAGLLTLFGTTMAGGQQASMATNQPSRPVPAVLQAAEAYRKAVLNRDADTVMSLFREDAIEMPPFQLPVTGRTAIREFYQAAFNSPVKVTAFTFSHNEVTAEGDVAYDVGTYKRSMTTPTGSIEASGPYVAILKWTDGAWRLAYLIYNCDCPPSMAQAPHTQASR